jgi:hypothetical protein
VVAGSGSYYNVNFFDIEGTLLIFGYKNVPVFNKIFCHVNMLDYAYN